MRFTPNVRHARAELVKAQQRADEATRTALKKLLASNLSVREAADLVGVSPGRVSQLVPTKKTVRAPKISPKRMPNRAKRQARARTSGNHASRLA